jgi:hypothetical protein
MVCIAHDVVEFLDDLCGLNLSQEFPQICRYVDGIGSLPKAPRFDQFTTDRPSSIGPDTLRVRLPSEIVLTL